MNQQMFKYRTAFKLADQLSEIMIDIDPENKLISDLKAVSKIYKAEYQARKQVEKQPTTVYQMSGKKTSELSPDEFRAYKAFLKRQRDAKARNMRGL